MNKNSEKGFSLIELCFAAAAFVVVMFAAYAVYVNSQQRESVQDEFLEAIEHYRQIDTAFRNDFDNAGANFNLPSDFRFSGGDYPLYFFSNPNWQYADNLRTDGVTLHQTASTNDTLHSSFVFRSGTGAASFRATPGVYRFALQSVGSTSNRFVQVMNTSVIILEDGQTKFMSAVAANDVRREVSINIEYLKNNPNVCVIAYYLHDAAQNTKSLMYRSSLPCPAYPMEVALTNPSADPVDIKNLKIAGTDMVNRDSGVNSFVYPSYNGQSITLPNVIVSNSANFEKMISIGGDAATDVFYTKSNIVVKENASVAVTVTKPFTDGVSLANGDVVNIIDYPGRHSVLGLIANVSGAGFTFTPLSSNQSYAGFYSLPSSYNNQQFFAGASVVKIAPPSEIVFGDRKLMQRFGSSPWQTVMVGVKNVIIQPETRQVENETQVNGQSNLRGYSAFFHFVQDGTETLVNGTSPRQFLEVYYTPKSINRDANN